MNLVLLEQQALDSQQCFTLTGDKAEHIFKVLRLKPNDTFRVGLLGGGVGQASIISLDKKHVHAQIQHLDDALPKALNITLLLALPRPNMLRRILQHVTELGIKDIHLFNSAKVVKSFWQSPILTEENFNAALRLGLEQSRDTVLPKLTLHKNARDFFENIHVIKKDHKALVAHPYGQPKDQKSVPACPSSISEPVVLCIGPEGGFMQSEVAQLLEQGFEQVHLGERILRVENAVTAFCARVANW